MYSSASRSTEPSYNSPSEELKEKQNTIKHDPFEEHIDSQSCLYLDEQIQSQLDVITALLYGIPKLIIVSGDADSGKTSLLKHLTKITRVHAEVAWLEASSKLKPEKLLKTLLAEFGIASAMGTNREQQLRDFLAELDKQKTPGVLIVDNAEQLSEQVLRDMADMLSWQPIPLRVVLSMSQEAVSQLATTPTGLSIVSDAQHIRIRPLTKMQTIEYINRRLQSYGLEIPFSLTDVEIAKIYRLSRGKPGLINQYTHNLFKADSAFESMRDRLMPKLQKLANIKRERTATPTKDKDPVATHTTLAQTDSPDEESTATTRIAATPPQTTGIKPTAVKSSANDTAPQILTHVDSDQIPNKRTKPLRYVTWTNRLLVYPAAVALTLYGIYWLSSSHLFNLSNYQIDERIAITKTQSKSHTPLFAAEDLKILQDSLNASLDNKPVAASKQSKTVLASDGAAGFGLSNKPFVNRWLDQTNKVFTQLKPIPEEVKVDSVRLAAKATAGLFLQPTQSDQANTGSTVKTPGQSPAQSPALRAAKTDSTLHGNDWIKSKNPRHYTIILFSAQTRKTLTRFVSKHSELGDLASYQKNFHNRRWHVLIHGEFNSRQEAKAKVAKFSEKIRENKPVVIRFRNIQRELGKVRKRKKTKE